MRRKIFPILIALLLMILIGGGAVGVWLKDKYSYGTDEMDLRTYFEVEEGKLVIFVGNERIAEKAPVQDGVCYLNLNFVKSRINDGFYYDRSEKKLLYTDAAGTFEATPGEKEYSFYDVKNVSEYPPCIVLNDLIYVALPYAAMLSDLEYQVSDYRLQLVTSWEPYEAAQVTKDTKIRYRGGIKSEVLCDVSQGETVEVLENLEKWCRVRNKDGVIGYMENKFLGATTTVTPEKKTGSAGYVAPEYTMEHLSEKVCLGWHAIGGVGGNATLEEVVGSAIGMNVIAPTWFSLKDSEGNFRSFAESDYVKRAHKYGLEVWGTWDDFNYRAETGEKVDETAVFATTTARRRIVKNMVDTTVGYGIDGINLDFEKLPADAWEYFGQFLKELSVECRKNKIKLSVDNYMPNEGNKQYRLDVQGQVVDYVILMGYDEHWHGSGKPGSVASIGFITDGIAKTLESVPAEKLVNAVPFYTILWKIEGSTVTDEYLTLNNEPGFVRRMGVETVWDEEAGQNYMEWTQGSKTYKCWLEDLDSISMKLNVMSANDLAGVAAWRLGYGTQDVWTLLSAFKQM
jgi:spore germination protein YaaH